MKKILIVGISLLSISMVKAQSPFKVDFALGGAIPSGSGSKGGILFAVEPKYAVMPKLDLGLRIEGAVTARGFTAADGSSGQADLKAVSSYLATGDYYFTNEYFRPFVGAGAGLFKLAAASFDNGDGSSDELVSSSTKFGGMLRAGFEMGHFRLGVEYNLLGNTTATIVTDPTDPSSNVNIKAKNSYLGLKVGFFIGGGRK